MNLKKHFNFKSSLRQDEEFLQEVDALEMEVRDPEVELVSWDLVLSFQTFLKIGAELFKPITHF